MPLALLGGDWDGTTQIGTATLTRNWDSFSMTLDAIDTIYTPSSSIYYMQGPASFLKFDLIASKTLDFGGSITATVSDIQMSGFSQAVNDPNAPAPAAGAPPSAAPPPQVQVSTSGTAYSGLLSFKLAPVDWVYGLVSYKYQDEEFSNVDPRVEAAFQAETPETTTTFTIQVGLTKTF